MSRRLFGLALLLIVASSLSPTFAAKKKQAAKGDVVDSSTLQPGEYVGILKTTPGSDRLFTVEIEQSLLVPTNAKGQPGGNPRSNNAPNLNKLQQSEQKIASAQQRVVQAQQKIASAKTAASAKSGQSALAKAQSALAAAQSSYQQALNQVLAQSNAQANLQILAAIKANGNGIPKGFKIVKSKVTVEFQTAETVKVRTTVLPEEFDDKGKPKKRTDAERAALKGKDKNLPGYESTPESLEVGQTVRVYLVRKKSADKEDKEADKEDKEADTEKKRQARMIVILADAKPADTKSKKK